MARFRFLQEQNKQSVVRRLGENTISQFPNHGYVTASGNTASNDTVSFEVPLIPHEKMKVPASPVTLLFGMESWKVIKFTYMKTIHSALQDWNMSSKAFICVSIHDIISNLMGRIKFLSSSSNPNAVEERALRREISGLKKIAARYKILLISFVRQFICTFLSSKELIGDEFTASRLLMASSCIQFMNYFNSSTYDDSHYIAMVDMCLEIFTNNNPNHIAKTLHFIWSSFPKQLIHLYVPPYSSIILFEILQVLNDFGVHIRATGDEHLIYKYEDLCDFLRYVANLLPHANQNCVIAYPPNVLFHMSKRWTLSSPPEAYCILPSMPGTHKVFYTFYHSIASYLDALLPSASFIMHRPFYTSLGLCPYSLDSVLDGLDKNLGSFALFSIRLLSFMERRRFIIHNFFTVDDPLPDDLEEYRFRSRRVKNLAEVPIKMLNNSRIQWPNYPHCVRLPNGDWPREHGSFFAREKDSARTRLDQIKIAEERNELQLDFSQVSDESSHLYDSIVQNLKSPSPLSDGEDPVSISPSSFEYEDATGHKLNSKGLLADECDPSAMFNGFLPIISLDFPSIELITRFKEDRIALFTASTDHYDP